MLDKCRGLYALCRKAKYSGIWRKKLVSSRKEGGGKKTKPKPTNQKNPQNPSQTNKTNQVWEVLRGFTI